MSKETKLYFWLLNKVKQHGLPGILKKIFNRLQKFTLDYWNSILVNISPISLPYDELHSILFPLGDAVNKNCTTFVNDDKLCRQFQPGKFYFSACQIKYLKIILKKEFPTSHSITAKIADDILRHNFYFLGRKYQYTTNINWHNFPDIGRPWPLRYHSMISYKGDKILKDIKLTWELNRNQYFIVLGKAFCYAKEQKYADEFVEQIYSWIQANPVKKGVNWTNSLEVGMRLISWIWVYNFFKNTTRKHPDFLKIFLSSIVLHLRYIKKHLSLKDVPNNHLIGEACALVVGGLFFGGSKTDEPKSWLDLGLKLLEIEVGKQFFQDGVNKEQAMSYHRFSLDFYMLTYVLLHKNNISPPPSFAKYIDKALEFIMYTIKPNGESPQFGDSDNARAVFLSDDDYHDYSGSLAIGAVLFSRGDMKWVAGSLKEDVLWLLGTEGINKFNKLKSDQPISTSKAFPKGGYYIMRSSWEKDSDYMIFDCGPLGLGEAASHGHADMLSFELFCNSRTLFVDPGSYVYNANREWRDYFRSTIAHNTATVDGQNQSVIKSRMEWESPATPTVNCWISNEHYDLIDAQHDGYNRLNRPVTHRRIVFFNKIAGYWIIKDLFTGKGLHDFSINFQCNPEEEIQQESNRFILTNNNNKVMLLLAENNQINAKVIKGQKEPILGWFSAAYGEKVPTPVINATWQTSTPTQLLSVISPIKRETSEDIHVKSVAGNNKENFSVPPLSIEITRGHITDTIIIMDNEPTSLFQNNHITFLGKVLLFSKSSDNLLEDICYSDALTITISGEQMLSSKTAMSNTN